jgi:hypothetical protein
VSAVTPILAYRTPPRRLAPRLPLKIAAVAWAHVALSAAMVVFAHWYPAALKGGLFESVLTIWTVTMIAAPIVVGGAVLLGQRHVVARLIAAVFSLPLMPAELFLGIYGLVIVAIAAIQRDTHRATTGIATVMVAALLVGLTNLLVRYISTPCDPPTATPPS